MLKLINEGITTKIGVKNPEVIEEVSKLPTRQIYEKEDTLAYTFNSEEFKMLIYIGKLDSNVIVFFSFSEIFTGEYSLIFFC